MIRLHEPTFGQEEIDAAVAVMQTTQVTQGAIVRQFEDNFRKGSVACNSGSSANLLAISALVASGRLKPSDEVLVPALCWSTTVFPLIQLGLVPIFVDCDPFTLNIDPVKVSEALMSADQKIRAIMPVHVYGNPCDMAPIKAECELYDLWLIEDCCEAMGAWYDDEPIGSKADIATFSTYFSHHITTFEGGIAQTDNPRILDMMRIQRSHGWTRDVEWDGVGPTDPKFTFVDLGYNLRMTEVAAAVGLVQLPKLEDIVLKRRFAHTGLADVFDDYPWLRQQKLNRNPGTYPSCFGFTLVVDPDAPVSVQRLRQHFEAASIETRPIICGNMARQPVMAKYRHGTVGDLPHATYIMENGFSIGCHQDIGKEDIKHVSNVMGFLNVS